MRVIGRLLIALAIAFPISAAIAGVAHSDSGQGPAVVKCMHWKDVIKIEPGIGDTPSDQLATAHGKLFGCNKAGGAAQFTGTLQMVQATCDNLAMSGDGQFAWADGTQSSAALSFEPSPAEPRKVFVNGTITSGQFQGLIVRAWLRFTPEFSGSGVDCGPDNPLQKIRFTNTQSFQLLTPNVTSTTESPPPPTNPPTTQGTVPGTVPVTNFGTTTPATQPRRVTVIIIRNGCCRRGVLIHRRFPTGTLAFTGSSRIAAVFGLQALLIGGALACLDPDRKKRGLARIRRRRRHKSLDVTAPAGLFKR